MIRAVGWLSLFASVFVVAYTLGRNSMRNAYPVADRWLQPADPTSSYAEEAELVPRLVEYLRQERRAMHHLGIKAGLRLRPEVQPATVWRACKMAEEMGYVAQAESGHFYYQEEP